MKYFIITIIAFSFLLRPASTFSQQTEGMVKYLTTYDWVKMMNACDYLSKEKKDKVSYMWGNRSEWKIYTNLYFSSKKSKFEVSDEKAEPDDEGYEGRKETFYITRDFETNTCFDIITTLGKVYLIHDSLNAPDWKILNDIKEVAGHVCMNASLNDTLMKQKVIAWFALDIPVKAGPDRFFGLPGLILEVNINNGAKTMVADKIELKQLTNEFDLPKKLKGKQVTEKDYTTLIWKYMYEKRKEEEFPWGLNY